MAIDFENTPIEWKNKGVEPDNTLKNNGYASEDSPKAVHHNFLFAKMFDCIRELQNVTSNIHDTIADIPATDLGNHPNIDDVTETGFYTYINNWGEKDLLVVHTYPNRYVVQYRFTMNSVDRRYKDITGSVYNSWTAIASTDFAKQQDDYNETPTKIGTWVNGVPIYRIAFPWIFIKQTDEKYGNKTLMLDPDNGTIKISLPSLLGSKSILTSPLGNNYLYPVNISIFHWSEDFDWMFTPVKVDNSNIVLIENDLKRYQDYIEYGNGKWGGYVDISIPDAAFEG